VAQRRHDRGDTFAAVLQGGVQQPLGGIVDDGDQREPSLRAQRQPMVPTAVEMEQLAEAGARLAAAAMATPRLVLGHQAGGLQGLLHKGIAKAHAVFAAGQLVKMSDVEAQVPLAIEGQQALHLGDRGALRRRRLPPAVQQAVVPEMPQPPADPPDRARTVAQDVGGLHPGQFPVDRP
jgi:hypothetical protein